MLCDLSDKKGFFSFALSVSFGLFSSCIFNSLWSFLSLLNLKICKVSDL